MNRMFTPAIFILILAVTFGFAQTQSFSIYWDLNPEPDMYQYRLLRSVNGAANFQIIHTLVHPQVQTVDNMNINPGNLYSYKLAAVDSAGNQSPYSQTVSVGIPRVSWSLNALLTGVVTTLDLSNVIQDPDDNLSDLQISVSGQSHIQVSFTATEVLLTPEPLNYLGPAEFTVRVEDPDSLWDQRTIQVDISTTTQQEPGGTNPVVFELEQNFPNPFNPTTEIRFSLPGESAVEISIFNSLGQKIRTLLSGYRQQGGHSVYWDGRNDAGMQMASGTYFYSIRAGEFTDMKRMVLLK